MSSRSANRSGAKASGAKASVSRAEAATTATDSDASPYGRVEKLKRWWERLSRAGRVVSFCLIALLGLGPISGWVHNWWTHRQPGFDQRAIDAVTLGGTKQELERALDRKPIAVLNRNIPLAGGTVRNELYVMDTVYVEAFVTPSDDVVALTFTRRSDDSLVVGRHTEYNEATKEFRNDAPWLILGETTFTQAEKFSSGLRAMGGGCGAHILNYYELTDFSGASFKNYAFGITTAGMLKNDTKLCDFAAEIDSEPLAAFNQPEHLVDLHAPSDRFLSATNSFRSAEAINAVTIALPGIDIVQQMLELHPDTTGVEPPS